MVSSIFESEYNQWLEDFKTTLQESMCLLSSEFWEQINPFLSMLTSATARIEISLIRSQLLQEMNPIGMIELFDKNGFFVGLQHKDTFALPFLFTIWSEQAQKLILSAKKYMGKIPHPLVEQYLLFSLSAIEEKLADIYKQNATMNIPQALLDDIISNNIQISFGQYRRFQYAIF